MYEENGAHIVDFTTEGLLIVHTVTVAGDRVCGVSREEGIIYCWEIKNPGLPPRKIEDFEKIGRRIYGIRAVTQNVLKMGKIGTFLKL